MENKAKGKKRQRSSMKMNLKRIMNRRTEGRKFRMWWRSVIRKMMSMRKLETIFWINIVEILGKLREDLKERKRE